MLQIIAETYPRLIAALRRYGVRRNDAAGLILAARFGERAVVWTVADCDKARRIIRAAFANRPRSLRLQGEG